MMTFTEWRKSKKLVLVVVTIALLLDSTLVSVIVPILPNYLHVESNSTALSTNTSLTRSLKNNETFENNTAVEQEKPKFETHDSTSLGLLFASKAFVQVMVGPFVGILTDRIGFSIPMLVGFVVMFSSILMYAFVESYYLMFTARALQGLASALSSIPGLAMLSHWYPDNKERGDAMAIAFGGTGLGVIIGPIFGGVFYEYFGKSAPFLIIAGLALLDGCLRLLVSDPEPNKEVEKPKAPSLRSLFTDPYVMLSAGSLFLVNAGVAFLEPSLPIRMKSLMNASSIQQGLAFLAISLTFIMTSSLFARVGYWLGRWLITMLGLVLSGLALIAIPFANNMTQLMIPNAFLGLSLAMVESSILPFLGYLVDTRHSAVYGNVFAIADTAFCLAYFLGPAASGFLVNNLGFEWSSWAVAGVCFLTAPFILFLRNPPVKKEQTKNVQESRNATVLETVESYAQTEYV